MSAIIIIIIVIIIIIIIIGAEIIWCRKFKW